MSTRKSKRLRDPQAEEAIRRERAEKKKQLLNKQQQVTLEKMTKTPTSN